MRTGAKGFTHTGPTRKQNGFTLTEAILVVLFIGILSAITLPKLNQAVISRYKAETVAKHIVTQIRHTRSLAISNAVNNNNGFSLKFIGDEPYTGYELKNLDTEEILESHTVDPKVSITGLADEFEFGPLGNLQSDKTQIAVSAEGKSFTIDVIRATGTVKCTENE